MTQKKLDFTDMIVNYPNPKPCTTCGICPTCGRKDLTPLRPSYPPDILPTWQSGNYGTNYNGGTFPNNNKENSHDR